MSEIRVESLRHVYSAGTPFEKVAIEDVSLTIPQGQLVGIIGHTGSGKSTFIQHLNALLQPTSGKVFVDGKDINENKYSRRDVKWQVGIVFQYPEYQLFEETVYRDIAFGPRNMKLPAEEIDARVREAARFAQVDEELFERSPLELSGGQKRRIAIAGVIALRPGVLILDEPTAGLDPAGCRQILDNICEYHRQSGSTVIIVSHNMDDTRSAWRAWAWTSRARPRWPWRSRPRACRSTARSTPTGSCSPPCSGQRRRWDAEGHYARSVLPGRHHRSPP